MTRELKVKVITGSLIGICDAIEHEGDVWLVAQWNEAPSEGWKTPVRMLLLRPLRHQKLDPGQGAEYLVNEPLPKEFFDGSGLSWLGAQFVVRQAPGEIRIPIVKGLH